MSVAGDPHLDVTEAILVEDIRHDPFDGIQRNIPDDGPDESHHHIVSAPNH